ncbi:Ca2+-binding RTX toxin-like protein [Hamadaea flava]|uniref:Ca2+-binding RTX toxin-like protein n=1 Tax=Hamadaea flava TaxID=1742688 RepID=A0ABV8LNY1_9ACTN|nr:calcium-binding protein [Hamadaea flava]MCP2322728.1 Ca2+-binding RTX toxin-like protein [Hamadaea flava]
MGSRSRLASAIRAALALVLVTPVAVVVTGAPAHADPPAWETGLRQVVTDTAGWANGLSKVGQLAQPLPMLGVSAGSLVDADHLVQSASDGLTAYGLTNSDRDLGGGVRLTSTVTETNGVHELDLQLSAKREVTGKDFAAAGITAGQAVTVTGWATLRLKARSDGTTTYLVRDADAPRLDIDAVAHFRPDLDKATASVGILEVALQPGTTLSASAHLLVRVNDPNGDGKLAFGTGGELSSPGSLTGLVTAALDGAGGGKISDDATEAGPGSINATIKLGAAASGAPVGLPTLDATVTVAWPDVSTGQPTVGTSGLDGTIAKFKNMSPLDLAAGLAQLATFLSGVQGSKAAGNLNLPFLRGTYADAVAVNEKVTAFLKKHTYPKPEDPDFVPGTDDPAKAGQPRFTSLQQLLKLLSDEGLLGSTPMSFAGDKLAFSLALARTPGSAVALDPGAASVSGKGATFTPSGFSVPTNRFTPGALKGQRVVAGTSAGTVADNTATTVTLTGEWIGGRPGDDSSWVISSSDPHIGAVQLGDSFTQTLDDGKKTSLRTANAQASLAQVKPAYTAAITLVLDLRDNVGDATANADRVLLRTDPNTPLFTADFPITSAIDFYTKVGFLKVRVNGSLAVGKAAAAPAMLSVKFKQAQDLSLGALFQKLQTDPASLLDVTSSVRTTGSVRLTVPGDTGILGEGISATFSQTAGGDPVINATNLDGLYSLDFNADDPNALFATVVEAIKLINQALAAANGGSGIMDQKIPLLGKSPREMMGSDESGVGTSVSYTAENSNFLLKDESRDANSAFPQRLKDRTVVIGTKAYRILDVVDDQTLRIAAAGSATPEAGAAYAVRPELAEAVDRLLANPPETLQDALDMVNKTIGEGSGLSFALDQREGGPYLRIGLDWKRKFHTGAPLTFAWSGAGDLVSLDSSGTVALDVTGEASLGLLLPLSLDAAPLLDHSSHAGVTVSVAANQVALAARVGPLALELGKPGDYASVQGNLKVGLGTGGDEDKPVLDGFLGLSPELTTDGVDCGNGVGGANIALCARAPIFLNDCDPPAGSNVLSLTATKDFDLTPQLPDLGPCLQSLVLKLTDFNVGIDGYLAKLEEALRLASFDGKLPLVGDDLQQGQRFIHQLREDIKAAIGPVLANAPANSDGLDTALTAAMQQLDPALAVDVACRQGVAEPCSLAEVQSVRIQLTTQRGSPSAVDGCTGPDCLGTDVPLDLGVPGLALKAKKGDTGGVHVALGWKLHLDLVLDRTEGFYVATHSGGDLSPELQIGAKFDADDLEAQLAFIQVLAEKKSTAPLASAYFAIDLKGSAGEESCFAASPCTADPNAKLTLSELGDLGSLMKTNLTATIAIDWQLTAKVDPSTEVGSALPGISARFKLGWGISNHTGELVPGNLNIEFSDIAIDAGAFFSKILKPVLDKVKSVTGPLQPVIDTLYAPIPVLSDLSKAAGGPDITLIWLAKTFSTLNGGPNLDFVDTVRAVIDFINHIPDCTASCKIPIGAFFVNPAKALTTLASPASAASLIDNPQPVSAQEVKSKVDGASNGAKLFDAPAGQKSNAAKIGFTFPIFDNPGSLFGLLLGQDVELVGFDSGPLELGFSWRQSFGPVYAPPPVMITLSGSASVTARFMAGLDTKGIRHAIEAATDGTAINAVSLLDGLYFKTTDANGVTVPVVTLRGEIAAGAEVTLLIVKAGIEGGVRLTVGFAWNDPDNDGKFRLSEFLQALLTNPICLFTTSGQLSVFLRVYITIDLFLFSKTWSFTLVNAVLLDFRAQPDCSPPPPELGGVTGDTLVVFAGKFGKSAERGHAAWDNTAGTYPGDVVKVYALHYADANEPGGSDDFDGFAVEALGRTQQFLDPNLKRVVVDGRGYSVSDADKTAMSVIFLGDGDPSGNGTASPFDKTAVVFGSDGKDQIRTGTGPAYVDGGPGDDTIVTAEAPGATAWVAGGPGNDAITTGDGTGTVAGDNGLGYTTQNVSAGGKNLTGVVNWASLTPPAEDPDGGSGVDTVTVGHGGNTVYGNGGDDTLAAMVDDTKTNGTNVMVGGAGSDSVNGGNGPDKIYTYAQGVPSDPDADGVGDSGLTNMVDTGGGQDEVYGSAGVDLVVSHSANGQTGSIKGYGANDVLIGGYGTDQIFGGPGDDYLIAEPSDVGAPDGTDGYGPFRPVSHHPLPAGTQSQTKLLVGGLGSDHIIGGDGGATIFGDKHLTAEACADSATFAQPVPAVQGSADLILGGAGADVVTAGGGDDRTDLGSGADRACGQLGDDILALGGDDDKAWGGDGVDQIFGDAGLDTVYGNAGNDGLYGGGDVDTVEGDDGGDQIYGGDGADVLYGGSRAAGETDQGTDYVYGEEGADQIVGDNGTPADGGSGAYPLDLNGTTPTAGAGDVLHGGAQDDRIYGGLGDDLITGDGDSDVIEGNNGADTVSGGDGDDQIIGGSSQEASPGVGRPDGSDRLIGDADDDLIAGDNARFTDGTPARIVAGRAVPQRAIVLLDLGLTPAAGTSAGDYLAGLGSDDVLLGQGGADRVLGGAGADYAEGGPGSDWVEGDLGDDDLVGGSSTVDNAVSGTGQPDAADALFGGPNSDVILGDNGAILRPLAGEAASAVTGRLNADGSAYLPRIISLLDRGNADPVRHGGDRISGGDGADLAYGQDGDDAITGDGDADYLEGNGGTDTLRGDLPLGAAGHSTVTPLPAQPWPGAAGAAGDLVGTGTPDGQDDLIGGSSAAGFRDGADVVEGDGGDDVVLGDNGSLIRTVLNGKEKVYAERYATGSDLTNATVVRTHDPALPGPSTRFCTTAQPTCEPNGAWGADQLYGDGGNDGIWGQDGDDTVWGGSGDDDLFGELGSDTIYGEAGEDAIVGDRGGLMNQYLNADDVAALGFTMTLSSVPQETFTGFRLGAYDRRADLRHDTDGDVWIGSPTDPAMPHNGLTEGGFDLIRGGSGNDDIHGGWGDDVINGDSGGDDIFGAAGSDVLWGGKGCDPTLDAATPDCLVNGVFTASSRGTNDRFVDHVFGGSGESDDEGFGSDVLDVKPRGVVADCQPGRWPTDVNGITRDPCLWFQMTDMADASDADNQHHQGTDWIYGGWDRDVLEADVAQNGPNAGDRLFDWNGAYNLYLHCNASYGGYNDIRQHSPAMQDFLTRLAWASGAGRTAADVGTAGTSAFGELAFTYVGDTGGHGAGKAYPGTPGHFSDPVSCTD